MLAPGAAGHVLCLHIDASAQDVVGKWGPGIACVLAAGFRLPFYICFYLVEWGGCSKRAALGVVLCSAGSLLLFVIMLKAEQTSSKLALFACIRPSKSTPCAAGLLIIARAYLSIYRNVKQQEENNPSVLYVPWIPLKTQHSVWRGAALQKAAKHCLKQRKSYPFSPVVCIFSLLHSSGTEFSESFCSRFFQSIRTRSKKDKKRTKNQKSFCYVFLCISLSLKMDCSGIFCFISKISMLKIKSKRRLGAYWDFNKIILVNNFFIETHFSTRLWAFCKIAPSFRYSYCRCEPRDR